MHPHDYDSPLQRGTDRMVRCWCRGVWHFGVVVRGPDVAYDGTRVLLVRITETAQEWVPADQVFDAPDWWGRRA